MFPFCRTSPCAWLTASALFNPAGLHAQGYTVSNLVADLPGAANIDTNLVNAWGLAILPKDMLIVNANENAIAGLYGTDGKPTGSYLAVNPAPSGLAVNRGSGFKVTDGQMMRPSTLIFVTDTNSQRQSVQWAGSRLVGTPPGMMAAHRSSPGFDPTRQRGPTVWEMCRLLSGNGISVCKSLFKSYFGP